MRIGRGLFLAGLVASLVVTTACGSDSEKPAATQPTVDLSQLDVGNNRTTFKEYGKPNSPEQAKLVAAMRLGNQLPLPHEIDPESKYPPAAVSDAVRTFIQYKSSAIKLRMRANLDQLDETAGKGLICGFVTTARSSDVPSLAYELENLVMLYDTAENAAAGANALADAEMASEAGNEPIQIGKFPTARGQVNPGGPGQLRSWYAVGRYVIFTYVYDSVMGALKTADQAKLVALAEKSIETISPRIKEFPAVTADKLMDQDVDPDGVLGRALHTVSVDENQRGIPGVYDRHGGLQLSSYPVEDAKLFEETGVDRVAWQGGFVFRARDAAGAQKVAAERAKLSRVFRSVESPKNLPFARCIEYVGPERFATKYYCTVSFDRYAAWQAANQLNDLHQRISAQYAVLASAK